MPEVELQRCPNCGGAPKLHKKRNKYYYECDGDCWTSTSTHSILEGAVREWNGLKKRAPERECLFCKHSMSGDAPDGSQVLVCFCCAGYEGKEVQADEVCENYEEGWAL